MATFSNASDAFYDDLSGTSPRAFRNAQLSRPNARNDGYGNMGPSMFGNEGSLPTMRFDNVRDGFGGPMQNHGVANVHFPYDAGAAQTWSSNGGPHPQSFGGGMGGMPQNTNNYGPSRSVKPSRGRVGLSNLWVDQPPAQMQQQHSTIVGHRSGFQGRNDQHDDDDELIPTAIVIKNIPFAVKKEQLVQLMVDMSLPLPYAFNYHFDNGVFRGLAFANFTSPQETEQVIQALNHMDLSGRKLRVEYKKMLPLAERERIEREKRERRGQLEEQHRPLPQSQLHNQVSMSSISRNTPSPLSHRGSKPDVDMNDPKTLEFYTEMTLFKRDPTREVLIFPPTLEPPHRRVVHTLAHHMGLMHTSRGTGDQRQVHIHRPAPGTNVSPPTLAGGFVSNDGLRQTLGRSSTADFSDGGRHYDGPQFNTLRGQSSVGLLDVMDSNAFGRATDSNLRNAKSFADLRSWSPSPVPSSASFPAALQTNGARLQALNDTAGSSTPTLTPTAVPSASTANRDEPFLISSFSNLSMGNNAGSQTSPRRQRSFFRNGAEWNDNSTTYQPAAPIGSKRTVSIGPENSAQNANPMRQARGPGSNNTIGFRRQNGRGSDELRAAASAIAE
ncbi:hypothetical protein A1O3_00444 [Capronia epimyces CBS 606.96]|uniref:R3H domain-containing protein n=1 Tax=Capronia epimyces CBS 606.96 TaxID=1182542 RepID=W9ZBL9_9EURO|nr:uncharacterized protein A1O3_00444 [Capronia epimyces CBS 606.96]EXJ91894.1 hypothetical protein A1O3_00444 [Capronia epimyces CBS 606.96]